MSRDLVEALAVARGVVAEAADLLKAATDNVGEIRTKSGIRDFVTQWDTRSEDLIREGLHQRSPGTPILGEEAGESGGSGGDYRWLIDPIDGTVNFSHGLPLFGVTVSLEHHGQPVVGVTRAPALGWEFYAHKGGGAFMNDAPISVSEVGSLERSMLATGFAYDRAESKHNFPHWEHFQRTAGACRRLGAASLDLCMVARGWLDGYWETRLHPWDLSAGAIIVAEAGGRVSDFDGSDFVSETGAAVATNGAIHQSLLDELATLGRP
jgi:myo-inositol-1(or 4)-monophosphatase